MELMLSISLINAFSSKSSGWGSAAAKKRDFDAASEDTAAKVAVRAASTKVFAILVRGSTSSGISLVAEDGLSAAFASATLKTRDIVNAQRYFMFSFDKTVQQTGLFIVVSQRSDLQLAQINLFRLIILII